MCTPSSLPHYLRRFAEFVTLIEVSGITNEADTDRASLVFYNSRGWCRWEHLGAVSPALDTRSVWYDYWLFQWWPFAFMDERFINLLEGNFRDGEAEKARISPMVIQICGCVEMNSGMYVVR